MEKKVIKSNKAPASIGPYSLAVEAGGFVFTSGQLGIDPVTGEIVPGGVEAETEQAIRNLKSALEAAESSLENVVKTTVFLQDIADFGKMNLIYAKYFLENPPARSAFQVGALPKNGKVEIEAVAVKNELISKNQIG